MSQNYADYIDKWILYVNKYRQEDVLSSLHEFLPRKCGYFEVIQMYILLLDIENPDIQNNVIKKTIMQFDDQDRLYFLGYVKKLEKNSLLN